MTSRDQLQEILCNRLFWYIAECDDARVADHLFHRREMDVVYAMDEAALFDSFFNSLQEIKVFPHLEQLDPQKQQRKNVPFLPDCACLFDEVPRDVEVVHGYGKKNTPKKCSSPL